MGLLRRMRTDPGRAGDRGAGHSGQRRGVIVSYYEWSRTGKVLLEEEEVSDRLYRRLRKVYGRVKTFADARTFRCARRRMAWPSSGSWRRRWRAAFSERVATRRREVDCVAARQALDAMVGKVVAETP